MSKNIYPGWSPSLVVPHVRDASDDLRALRGDAKGGLLGGYAGSVYTVWREVVSANSGAGGTTYVNSSTVPAGYLYVSQCVIGYHDEPVARLGILSVMSGAGSYMLDLNSNMSAYVTLKALGDVVLQAGDNLRCQINGFGSNQNVYLNVVGYMVKL